MLRSLERHKRARWHEYCPLVQLAMNTAWHRSINDQPLYVLTGRNTYFPTGDTNRVLEDPGQEALADLRARRDHVRRLASNHMMEARLNWTRWYDEVVARAPRAQYSVGDAVMRLMRRGAAEGMSGSWAMKWDGPWRIDEVRGPVSYLIKEVHGERQMTVHTNDLKVFYAPTDFWWPQPELPADNWREETLSADEDQEDDPTPKEPSGPSPASEVPGEDVLLPVPQPRTSLPQEDGSPVTPIPRRRAQYGSDRSLRSCAPGPAGSQSDCEAES